MATQAFEQIAEDFEFLESWEDRYRYIIDLGRKLVTLDDGLKCPATIVEGCASQVWLKADFEERGSDTVFTFAGDSDAVIVKGLIGILAALYNGLSPSEVARVDAGRELDRLGLKDHLTAQRSNGLASMVVRIRSLALAS